MASKGYTISVATDSRLFEQGVRMGIIKPVEEADDALTDLGKNRGPEELADDLQAAQRATDKLGDEVRQSTKQMQSDYRRTGQVARDAADEGGDGWARSTRRASADAGESVKEFGNEAKQNISETFSSFRGDVSDFGQIAQDTLGGLASGLEGIPAIAAVAAGAAGIGLILGAIETGQAHTEEWKAAVSDLAQAYIDAGGDASTVWVQRAVDKLKELATATEGVKLGDLAKDADTANISFERLARTWSGSEDDLRGMWRELNRSNEALWDSIRAAQKRGDSNLEEKLHAESAATMKLRDEIGQQIGITQEAAAQYEAYVKAGGPELEAKAQAVQEFADSIQSSLADAGSSWGDYNRDGVVALDDYNQQIEHQMKAVSEYQENIKTLSGTLTQDALNYVLSLGQDAAPIIQAFVDAPKTQQDRTAANWAALGQASASSYKNKLQNDLANSTVSGPRVVIDDIDTSRIPGMIQQTLNGHRFEVPVYANPRVGAAVG